MEQYSDENLVKLYLDGDDEALTILVRRYFKRVFNFIIKQIGDAKEAEDLTQEVFLKVWRNLKRFDANKSFRAWLWRIARNVCIDHLRRKKMLVFSALEKEGEEDELLIERIADQSESIIEKIDKQEIAREVGGYLMKLSEPSRAVLLLHYNQHLTFQEIAETLGEPLDTVKSRHRRALIALRKVVINNKMHQN